MKKTDFDNLSKIEKLEIINASGFEFESTFTKFGEIKLIRFYSINNFFAELIFDLETRNFDSIKSYESIMFLDKYESISKLMNWKIKFVLENKTSI